MPTTSISVPSVFNGISEQPPHMRLPSQVESAQNLVLAVQNGASKRPGSWIQFTLGEAFEWENASEEKNGAQIFPIIRDSEYRYVLLIGPPPSPGTDTVVKVARVGKSVNAACTVTVSTAAQTYLNLGFSTKVNRFRAVTVADYTLIANTTVNVKGTDASYTINAITAAASAEVTTTANHGLTTGDTVTIEGSNSTPVIDGTRVVTVVSATKFTVPVNTSGAGTAGTVYAGRLDATTMPLKLVRTGATTFTLDAIAWNQRTSGNTTTNPLPPFWTSGGTYAIADLAYYRGRLVLGGDEIVMMSQSDDLFDFWIGDATAVADSDPIRRTLSSDQVTKIDSMVAVRRSLFLFTKAGRQFELATGDSAALTTTNVRITPITSIPTVADIKPVVCDPSIFFVSRAQNAGQVYEIVYDEVSLPTQANWTNAHCPNLIAFIDPYLGSTLKAQALNMFAIPEHNLVGVLRSQVNTDGKRRYGRDIYIYRYFNIGGERVQSAWMEYVWDPSPEAPGQVYKLDDYRIWDVCAVGDQFYILSSTSVPAGDDPTGASGRTHRFWLESVTVTPEGAREDDITTVVTL